MIAKIIGLSFALLLCIIVLVPTTYLAAPRIEGYFLPIVKASFVSGSVMRNDRTLCWDLDFKKQRTGIPEYINFFVVDGRDRTPLAAYKPGGPLLSTYGFANRPPGRTWTSRYCVALPPTLEHDVLNIQGIAVYQTWNPLWPAQQSMPSFEVPPLD